MRRLYKSTVFIIIWLVLFSSNILAQRLIELRDKIIPCQTTKADVEKMLGESINDDKNNVFQTYKSESEKITVVYSNKREDQEFCSRNISIGTVLRFFVVPLNEIKLSELKIDLTKYKKNAGNSPREIWYYNEEEEILIVTEISEKPSAAKAELVTHINFNPKGISSYLRKRNSDKQKVRETERPLTDEEFHYRIDEFCARLNLNPGMNGYVINYGTDKEIAIRKAKILKHLKYRKFDLARVVFLKGRSNNGIRTEFEIVPPGTQPPIPNRKS